MLANEFGFESSLATDVFPYSRPSHVSFCFPARRWVRYCYDAGTIGAQGRQDNDDLNARTQPGSGRRSQPSRRIVKRKRLGVI